MLTKSELPVIAKTSRRNYLKVTQQRYSRKCDYLLLHVLKKFGESSLKMSTVPKHVGAE